MTNWFTSDDQTWINKKTGELIKFRYCKDSVEVWVYKTPKEERGQKVKSASEKKKAIKKAKKFAKRYEEIKFFSFIQA